MTLEGTVPADGVSVDHHMIKHAIRYIGEHYAQDLNLAIVSNELNMNYHYFSSLFK